MKVIDLLNKIANGEAPEKIKYNDTNYYLYDNYSYLTFAKTRFFDSIYFKELNDEVEIIEDEPRDIEVCGSLFTRSEYNRLAGIEEDKKIEKVDVNHLQTVKKWKRAKILGNKINEIIDYLEEKDNDNTNSKL